MNLTYITKYIVIGIPKRLTIQVVCMLLSMLCIAISLNAKTSICSSNLNYKKSNILIEGVENLGIAHTCNDGNESVLHVFTHGQPGELLVEGQWKGPVEIAKWLSNSNHLDNKSHLNIYGCNFAQGEKGKQAVSYLETVLGVSVAASDDITGIDGDWDLEVGASASAIQVAGYQANLQLCPDPKYSVFVHYPAGANNTNAAKYTIISSVPNFVVTVDQTNQNNSAFTALDDFNRPQEWVPLAHNLGFDGTGNMAVRLIENSSSTSSGMWINADAVMFVDQFGKRTIIDNAEATRTGSWNLGAVNVTAYNNRYHFIQTGTTGNNFVTWILEESEVIQSDDDQDGIPNGCDLDDDNDGILDVVECTTNDVTNGTFTGNLNGWTTTGNWFNRGGVDAYVNNDAAVSSDLSQSVTMNASEGVMTYDLVGFDGFPKDAFLEVYIDNVNVGRYSAAEIVAGAAAQGTSYYRVKSAIRGTCGGTTEILFRAIVEAGSGSADDVGVDNVFVGTCDADGDCIANHLEIDSDNDSCGDAIEATGSTYLLGDLDGGLGVDLAIHPIDTNGVPANSTNTGIGTSTNDQIQSLECDQCGSASSLYVDTDGDGIGNACDADDDNDGILDCDERFTGGVQFSNPLGTNEHFFPGSFNTYTGSAINSQNLLNGTISSDPSGSGNFGLATNNPTGGGFKFVGNYPISYLEVLPYDNNALTFGIFTVNDVITFDADVPITIDNPSGRLKVYINGAQNTATTITTRSPITIVPVINFDPNPDYKLTMEEVSEFSIYLASSTPPYPNGATFKMNTDCLRLDTDEDGVPDDLDLDSDGDGCPDALESAGNSYTWNDLNPDGSIETTLHPINVDGIPNNGIGFGKGTSKDPNIVAAECDACNIASTLYADHDGDNIGDVCDLDDDNDGILDIDELACEETLPIDFSNFNSNGTIPDVTVNGELIGVTANLISGGSFIGGDANGNVGLQVGTVGVPVIFELQFSKEIFPVFGSKTVSGLGFFEDPELWEVITGTSMVVTDLLDELDLPVSTAGGFTNSVVISPAPAVGTNNPFNQSWQVVGLNSSTIRLEYTNSLNAPNNSGINLSICTKFVDTDGDGLEDYLDLDSDNDGIYDLDEAGHNGADINEDGIIDGAPSTFGTNGLHNSVETSPDNGNINYTLADSNNDGVYDPYELDSDGDGCLDTEEESVSDLDDDGIAGSGIPTVNLNGLVNGITYSAPPNNTWQNPLIGPCLPEICNDNIDNDGDGNADCLDGDCGLLNISSVVVGPCIDDPLADRATLDVTVDWNALYTSDIIEVSIYRKTEYIDIDLLTSPQTISFNIPADGSIGDSVIVTWSSSANPCLDFELFDAPAPCSNDSIMCSILYLCSFDKPYDGDSWDHGWLEYLDGINGNALLTPVATKDEPGLGLYDAMDTSMVAAIDINDYDIIIISATTEFHISSDLVDTLKHLNASILNSNQGVSIAMGYTDNTYVAYQEYLYVDDSNTLDIYNFNNLNSTGSPVFTGGDVMSGGDDYLWMYGGGQTSNSYSAFIEYEAHDNLPIVGYKHGKRILFGYHMNGVYGNPINGGLTPVPVSGYFDPIRHLTGTGKIFFDQAILSATNCDFLCKTAIMNPHIMYHRRKL